MHNKIDEKIQALLEQQTIPDAIFTSEEQAALAKYTELFSILKDDQHIEVPNNFASSIGSIIQEQQASKRNWIVYVLSGVIFFTVVYLGSISIDQAVLDTVLTTMEKHKWIIVFTAVVLGIIQYVDKKLVQQRVFSADVYSG